MNKSLRKNKCKWKETSYYRIYRKRIALGYPLMAQAFAVGEATIRGISQVVYYECGDDTRQLFNARKALAIAKTTIETFTSANNALHWWRK
jgi:hypothetical protein